jgi:hypothetical protein
MQRTRCWHRCRALNPVVLGSIPSSATMDETALQLALRANVPYLVALAFVQAKRDAAKHPMDH